MCQIVIVIAIIFRKYYLNFENTLDEVVTSALTF